MNIVSQVVTSMRAVQVLIAFGNQPPRFLSDVITWPLAGAHTLA
jgi:hypothetical protein